MSAYGKPQPPLHGYDTGRTFPEGTFAYPAPIYGQSSAHPSTTSPPFQDATPMTEMAYAQNQSRTAYDEQTGPYLNVGSTPIPEVKSFKPPRGTKGTKFYVSITTLYELLTSNEPSFFLMFGQRKVPASVKKVSQQGAVCQYSLAAEVPQLVAMGWSPSHVPVSMCMEAGDGDLIAKVEVGDFTYVDVSAQATSSSPQENSRKRKVSSESAELMKSPAKRTSSQQLRPKEEFGPPYGYTSTDGTPNYSPYLQPTHALQTGHAYNVVPQFSRSVTGYQAQSSRNLGYGYSGCTTASPPTTKAQSPQVANWGSSYPGVGSNLARSPGVPSNVGMPRPALTSLPSPAVTANPPLIRASTLQQTPSLATTPHEGHPGAHYNAYSLYPHKVKLEINGDLDALAHGWSEEEWEAKRRIIHFRRSQSGITITTTFGPVSVDERPPNSICISCIYWEEREECFVTSVDTIYLLEQLVAARFTVEEKNRIRRNLEGFRPLTVSKAKPDSEEFFKVIMAFPAPKPRNIEKDVKVFHWKDLASALKKIMGKYCASPSSTLPPAPALLTPVSSTGYVTEGSAAGLSYAGDHHGAVSPRSISGSTTSTAYNQNIPARALSPQNQKAMALQTGPSDLRVAVPHLHPHETPGHWQGGGHHLQGSQQYQQLGSQSARSSWDMSPYLENNPANAGGNSIQSQSLNFQTPRNVADTAGSGSDNRIARSLSSQQQQSHQMPRT